MLSVDMVGNTKSWRRFKEPVQLSKRDFELNRDLTHRLAQEADKIFDDLLLNTKAIRAAKPPRKRPKNQPR